MSEVIRIRHLSKRFGGVVVADDINLAIDAGAIVGLIGPNGAGKTSLFNLISGAVPADAGSISLDGVAIEGMPMHARGRLGVSRSWQHNRLFPSLTVLDNLLLAERGARATSLLQRFSRNRRRERSTRSTSTTCRPRGKPSSSNGRSSRSGSAGSALPPGAAT